MIKYIIQPQGENQADCFHSWGNERPFDVSSLNSKLFVFQIWLYRKGQVEGHFIRNRIWDRSPFQMERGKASSFNTFEVLLKGRQK